MKLTFEQIVTASENDIEDIEGLQYLLSEEPECFMGLGLTIKEDGIEFESMDHLTTMDAMLDEIGNDPDELSDAAEIYLGKYWNGRSDDQFDYVVGYPSIVITAMIQALE